MRRRRSSVASIFYALMLVGGCSLTSSLDDLVGTRDAAVDHVADAVTDRATDAPVDAGLDTSLDAGDAPSEVAKGFCASLSPAPTQCDDFDEHLPVGTGWTNVNQEGTGAVEIDLTRGSSPPASLRASIGALQPDAGTSRAGVYLALEGTPSKIKLALDVAFDQFDPNAYAELTQASIVVAGTGTFYLLLALQKGSLALIQEFQPTGGTYQQKSTPFLPMAGSSPTFRHLELDLDLNGSAPTANVSVDNVPTLVAESLVYGQSAGSTSIYEGFSYVPPPSLAWEVHIDNVTIDASP